MTDAMSETSSIVSPAIRRRHAENGLEHELEQWRRRE
jgi:hypothetical protein